LCPRRVHGIDGRRGTPTDRLDVLLEQRLTRGREDLTDAAEDGAK
jgi:hypothetical protein